MGEEAVVGEAVGEETTTQRRGFWAKKEKPTINNVKLTLGTFQITPKLAKRGPKAPKGSTRASKVTTGASVLNGPQTQVSFWDATWLPDGTPNSTKNTPGTKNWTVKLPFYRFCYPSLLFRVFVVDFCYLFSPSDPPILWSHHGGSTILIKSRL